MTTSLHERLRQVRKALNLSQKDMAASLDINFSTLSEIERGKNGLGVDLLKKLVNQHRVNPLYLLNGAEPMITPMTKFEEMMSTPTNLGVKVPDKLGFGGKLGDQIGGKLGKSALLGKAGTASFDEGHQTENVAPQHVPGAMPQNLDKVFLHFNQRIDHLEEMLKQLLQLAAAD